MPGRRLAMIEMFDSLSDRLGGVFERLRKRGALEESDVSEAMREIRIALLEADVALPVVKSFVAKVKERAIGQDVVRSVTTRAGFIPLMIMCQRYRPSRRA